MAGLTRDGLIVALGGQVERALGTLTTLALRWGLDPARLGVYTGLRLFLDNTNRSSLGVGLGAVQEIPALIASGRDAEARRVADVAHTANSLTCLLYSAALIAWALLKAPSRIGDPLAAEWTWGLVAVAVLAMVKRYESFLIAVFRARGEFALTTRLDVVEASVSAVAVASGLWLAGFWGLLAAVGVILIAKISYLHVSNPLRLRWAWDVRSTARLMGVGLPILANTAAFGAVMTIDRALILAFVPDGERSAGLYTVALLGAGWGLDLAGRLVTVLSTHFLATLGRTADPKAVAIQAMRATEAQAPILAAGGAIAYVFAPAFLGMLIPRYVEGLPALRPLVLGSALLALAWPARQMLLAVGRPWRLGLATAAGFALILEVGTIGAVGSGLVGVAWGMTIGYSGVFLLTSFAAFVAECGARAWAFHLVRVAGLSMGFGLAAILAAHVEIGRAGPLGAAIRGVILAVGSLPAIAIGARAFPEELSGFLARGRGAIDRFTTEPRRARGKTQRRRGPAFLRVFLRALRGSVVNSAAPALPAPEPTPR